MGLGVVEGEVRSGQVQLQEILLPGQVKRARFVAGPLALLEEVGDLPAGRQVYSQEKA